MSDDWLYGGRRRPARRGRAARRPDGGGPDGDGSQQPDGDATRPVPRQSAREPKPDETRVMPTVSRQPSGAPPAPAGPRPPREAPPPPRPPARSGGGFLDGVRRWSGRVGRPRFKLRYLWL